MVHLFDERCIAKMHFRTTQPPQVHFVYKIFTNTNTTTQHFYEIKCK